MFRVEKSALTNGAPISTNYNPYWLLEVYERARKISASDEFRSEMAGKLGVGPHEFRMVQVEQFRCTTILDATFEAKGGSQTNGFGWIACQKLVDALATNFPNEVFKVQEEKLHPPLTPRWCNLLHLLFPE